MVSTRYPHNVRIQHNIIHSPFVVKKLHDICSILGQARADADILRKIVHILSVYSLFADSHSIHRRISANTFQVYVCSKHTHTRAVIRIQINVDILWRSLVSVIYISVRYTLVQIGFTALLMLVRYIVIYISLIPCLHTIV